jgi:hypothetical protein
MEMKKIFILALVAAAATTACRKERTCECTTKTTTVTTGYGAGQTEYVTSNKVTKAKQKKKDFRLSENCYSYKTTDTYSGGGGAFAYTDVTTTEETCEVK